MQEVAIRLMWKALFICEDFLKFQWENLLKSLH